MPGQFKKALNQYQGPSYKAGYGNLLQILQSQGQTDPRLMNRNLADIALQNQEQMRQAQGGLAASGNYGTVGGQGLLAAIGQGGAQMRSDYLAREAALQEQRKREDLQLMQLLFGPKFQRRGLINQMQIARMNQPGGTDYGQLLAGLGQTAMSVYGG